ncbi:MAG: hypothetical protein E7478_02305 [Ruminococcaceae bacterium]|nr:hypothetical protein [Oscillospiraceae bacterium]
MICPFCDKEMLKGTMSGDGRTRIRWKEGDKPMGIFEGIGGIGLVTAAKYTWGAFAIKTYFCRKCKKMIIDTDVTK